MYCVWCASVFVSVSATIQLLLSSFLLYFQTITFLVRFTLYYSPCSRRACHVHQTKPKGLRPLLLFFERNSQSAKDHAANFRRAVIHRPDRRKGFECLTEDPNRIGRFRLASSSSFQQQEPIPLEARFAYFRTGFLRTWLSALRLGYGWTVAAQLRWGQ